MEAKFQALCDGIDQWVINLLDQIMDARDTDEYLSRLRSFARKNGRMYLEEDDARAVLLSLVEKASTWLPSDEGDQSAFLFLLSANLAHDPALREKVSRQCDLSAQYFALHCLFTGAALWMCGLSVCAMQSFSESAVASSLLFCLSYLPIAAIALYKVPSQRDFLDVGDVFLEHCRNLRNVFYERVFFTPVADTFQGGLSGLKDTDRAMVYEKLKAYTVLYCIQLSLDDNEQNNAVQLHSIQQRLTESNILQIFHAGRSPMP